MTRMAEVHEMLLRMTLALERLAPAPRGGGLEQITEGYLWQPATGHLNALRAIDRIALGLLHGIARQAEALIDNTRRFARGGRANNALL